MRRDRHGGSAEHQVGEDRAADRSQHLGHDVARHAAPWQAAEDRVSQADHRVQVGSGDGPNGQDDGTRPASVARAFSSSSNPTSLGESRWTAMPLPTTLATRRAVPTNSAARFPLALQATIRSDSGFRQAAGLR